MNFKNLLGKYKRLIFLPLAFLVIAVAFWFGLKATLRTELPLLPVSSESMYPALNYGDLVVVQGVADVSGINVASASENDIVVFRRPDEPGVLVISRVTEKIFKDDAWYLSTQFDTHSRPDRWISGLDSEDTLGGFFHERFLVGKVVGRIPLLGYVPLYVGTLILNPVTMSLIAIVVCVILFLKYPFLYRKKVKD